VTTDPTSTDGQPLGKRGLQTREQILKAVADCIERQGLRGLRLTDVATEVGFKPPAFYQYFSDLDEAILALCEEIGHLIPAFPFPENGWNEEDMSAESTRTFVRRFFQYWDDHRAVLWSRNVAVTTGDARLQAVRDEAFRPMVEALRARIEAGQREGRVDPSISPRRLGSVLTVMLDRIGMLAPQLIKSSGNKGTDELVDAVTYVFDRVLGTRSDDASNRRRAAPIGRTGRRKRG
jgi:AcrR family transcriptional regulator